jgi:two-component system sensor histidine kinase ChvG
VQLSAAIAAGTLSEYATDPDTHTLKVAEAEPLLRQLIAPTRLRARLYLPNGRLAVDTVDLLPGGTVREQELPELDRWTDLRLALSRFYDGVMGVRPFFTRLAPYLEGGDDGRFYQEVDDALNGKVGSAERVDDENKLVLSVAVPVERFRAIYGVLFISTEGGDIDDILRQERFTLIDVCLVAFAVMLLSSLYLAGTIAEPIRRLAAAADRVRQGMAGRDAIPSLERRDEIGDLAESIKEMTAALYDRIGAIERFAADVAHELKNPLTSLASAMEMLVRAPDDDARQKLMALARADVKRIDRLITDISDASRLDAELSREARGPIELSHLLKIIAEIYHVTELSRGLTVTLIDGLPPGTRVMGNDERLGQVFRNLIDNAISFSPQEGVVTVTARMQGRVARINVDDSGPGIPSENLESIFERFYTERPAAHFGNDSGLGLSIARQITQNSGGRIWAENKLSENNSKSISGARFVVELPVLP